MKAHLLSLRRVRLRSTLLAVWSLIATLTSFWGIFGSRDENASSSSTCLPCHGITQESSVNTSMRLKGFQKSDPLETEPSFSCYSSKSSHPRKNQGKLPTIYVITPTYERPAQLADLTRMAQTLAHVAELFWVLVQDSREREPLVHDFLRYTNINYTYITVDESIRPKRIESPTKKILEPRGVACRMTGLAWVRKYVRSGVVYFADDDNSYDIRLFHEMRLTKRVSMWPVGLVTAYGISSPIVDLETGRVTGFYDGWIAKRMFPVDMAGFAVTVSLLLQKPQAMMPFRPGFEEDGFLKSLGVQIGDIEPKASNCTKVLVWHTKTLTEPIDPPTVSTDLIKNTNLMFLLRGIN